MTLAFVFPGQGSQSVGMLGDLHPVSTIIHKTFAEASEVLGYNLWRLVQDGPEEQLNDTRYTQPAMLAAGIAIWRLWQARGGETPAYLAGHSLGEYTALVAAEALPFASAVQLVEQRAEFMQSAVNAGAGAMAAILGLSDADVVAACSAAAGDGHVAPANFNAPGQVVIAGDRDAVERAIEAARAAGAKRAMVLPVSVPSHCELMRPAAEQLDARLGDVRLQRPVLPIIHNADTSSQSEPAAIRRLLVEQLYRPVRWVETVQLLRKQGVQRVIECGPGKVLAGLNKRIDRELETWALHDASSFEAALDDNHPR